MLPLTEKKRRQKTEISVNEVMILMISSFELVSYVQRFLFGLCLSQFPRFVALELADCFPGHPIAGATKSFLK